MASGIAAGGGRYLLRLGRVWKELARVPFYLRLRLLKGSYPLICKGQDELLLDFVGTRPCKLSPRFEKATKGSRAESLLPSKATGIVLQTGLGAIQAGDTGVMATRWTDAVRFGGSSGIFETKVIHDTR